MNVLTLRRLFFAFLAAVLVSAAFIEPPAVALTDVSWVRAKVIRWVDGDTVKTTRGTVRMVGIDTPEVGTCGSGAATRLAKRIAPAGSTVRLGNPRSVTDKDRYGRLLRYVDRQTIDIGAKQIRKGAKARYDGRDGYQRHPRQPKYRRIDANNKDYSCGGGGSGGGCSPAYPGVCIPPPPPDLNCGDVPFRDFAVRAPDPHNFDGDGDGRGCET